MIVQCANCKIYYDDEFRWTKCPHDAFAANDGKNVFSINEEAYRSLDIPNPIKYRELYEGAWIPE